MAAWDAEVGDASVVEYIALWGSLEGFFVFEDPVLETPDLFRKTVVLHRGIGLPVGDCCEESICNCAKEDRIDVGVCGEGGLDCPRRHCWRGRSRRMRNWKGCQRFGGRDI